MKNKRILQYRKDGKLSFVEIREGYGDKEIHKLKGYLNGKDYKLNDHTIIDTHKLYGEYNLEVDKCGYLYFQKDTKGKTAKTNKGYEVTNFNSFAQHHKKHLITKVNKLLKENGGELYIYSTPKKMRIWKSIFSGCGYTVKESMGHYGKRILILSK